MIQVWVNDVVKEENEKDYKNFRDFLDKHLLQGKVLAEVQINDQDIPLSAVSELNLSVLDGGEVIKLVYKDYKPFTVELIGNIAEYLKKLDQILPIFAGKILSSDTEAIRGIKDLSEGLNSILTMKENVFVITGTKAQDYPSLTGLEPAFSDILNRINEMIEKKDWIGLSDTLEYDLPGKLSSFQDFFAKAKEILLERNA